MAAPACKTRRTKSEVRRAKNSSSNSPRDPLFVLRSSLFALRTSYSSWQHLLADGGVQAMEGVPVSGLIQEMIAPDIAVGAVGVQDLGIRSAARLPGRFHAIAYRQRHLESFRAFLLQGVVSGLIILQCLLEVGTQLCELGLQIKLALDIR